MKILAIDTATEACSAALTIDGDVLEKYEVAPRKHAELILPLVDGLLAEAELKLASLDALAFGRGPGAFTGVRIATGVIQGLAYAAELPVIPVSTLAAMAQGASSKSNTIISAIDARMGEIYWGMYSFNDNGIVSPLSEEQISNPALLEIETSSTCFGVGTGWGTYEDVLTKKLGGKLTGFDPVCFPHARDILTIATKELELGNSVSAAEALPVYLRNKVTS